MPLLKPLTELRPLRDPVFLGAFTGRGGGSAAAAVQYFVDQWGATAVAELDAEESFDFTVRRPVVRLEHGERVLDWPANRFYVASPAGLDRDFILLPGIEPHLRWRAFTDAIAECLAELTCTTAVILGSRSGALPHTRPVPFRLVTTESFFARAFGVEPATANYEGPTGLNTVLSERLTHAGIATATLSALTPFYVSTEPNAKAVIALARAMDSAFGTSTPLELLETRAAEVDRAAEEAAAQSSELRSAIATLEQQYDAAHGSPTPAPNADSELPSGTEAIAQLEEFLRELRDPPGGRPS